jgi:hypothetical protein
MTDDAGLARLGRLVAERRQELRLSIEAAAKRGKINRLTWRSIEAGEERERRDTTFPGVEEALEWERGSVDRIMRGGTPAEIDPPPAQVPDAVEDAARLLSLVRSQFGEVVYEEALKVVQRAQPDTLRDRRNG